MWHKLLQALKKVLIIGDTPLLKNLYLLPFCFPLYFYYKLISLVCCKRNNDLLYTFSLTQFKSSNILIIAMRWSAEKSLNVP
jgi:hypothetical protein